VTGTLRILTIVNAVIYFSAAAYPSGVIVASGALAPASIAEALLGLVLVAALAGLVSARLAYIVVLTGTVFGLSIVVVRGLLGVDLWIHIVMLVGLSLAFVLVFARRRA